MIQELLQLYQNDPRLFQLVERISMPVLSEPGVQSQIIYAKGLQGSSPAFLTAATFLHPSCQHLNHLIVLNDAEEAAYFHNTLENITGALDIFYFPSSFKNRKNYRLLNSSHVMLRTEALAKFTSSPLAPFHEWRGELTSPLTPLPGGRGERHSQMPSRYSLNFL